MEKRWRKVRNKGEVGGFKAFRGSTRFSFKVVLNSCRIRQVARGEDCQDSRHLALSYMYFLLSLRSTSSGCPFVGNEKRCELFLASLGVKTVLGGEIERE